MLDDFGFERIQRLLSYLAVTIAERSRFAVKPLRLVLEKTDVNVAVIRIRVQSRKPRNIVGVQSCRSEQFRQGFS